MAAGYARVNTAEGKLSIHKFRLEEAHSNYAQMGLPILET